MNNPEYSDRDSCTSKTKKNSTFCFLLAALVATTRAELPVARLHSIFPSGGQPGTTFQIDVEGTDLDDARSMHFSNAGITSERNATNAPALFSITIASNVPPGLYEARVIGRFGTSNPRFFNVDPRINLTARTNQTAATALTIPIESTISARATASAADFYKFEAHAHEQLLVACQGDPFDSQMKPALILYDDAGRELSRERQDAHLLFTPSETATCLLKVHDLQFRGGPQFPYRLTITTNTALPLPPRLPRVPPHNVPASSITAEQESNDHAAQKITPPCEIRGTFFPERDIDRFEFIAKKGDVFWLEVNSDRLGEPTDPFILFQKIAPGEKETVTDLHEFYSTDSNLGGALFNTATRDPAARLEIKDDGAYRVQLRDLFNAHPDPRRSYRLSIRPETPDFDLIALIIPPPAFEKDKREAQIWSSFLRSKDSLLLKILALRRDNFAGEISLRVDGLPEGVHASETVIPEGQNSTWLSITARDKPAEWTGPIHIVGQAKSGTREVEHSAAATTVLWNVPDYNNESVHSRLTRELMLSTGTEATPLALEPKQTSLQLTQASSIPIPLHVARSTNFQQTIKLRAYLDSQNDPFKEWQIEASASDSSFDLDAKAAKLSPGPHQLFFLAQTSGKIRRVRLDEVAALEEDAKKAAEKKDDTKKKEIEGRLQLRDVTAIFSSPIVKIFVNPAPTASK